MIAQAVGYITIMMTQSHRTSPARLAARVTDGQSPAEPVAIEDLWAAYQTTGDNESRDRLVLHYTGLVTYVASRVGASMPGSVDYSDLIQSGVIGLMDAVARFEPERGLRFETYAVTRIRGAIIDELRTLDWVPRSVRKKARDLDSAAEELQARFGRNPTSADLAEALDVTPNELGSTRAQVCRMRVVALDELLSTGLSGENVSLAETLADPFAQAPGDELEQRDVTAALHAALAAMPERERAVLVQSYIEGLTLSQIGTRLGVTESRVSQIRTKALREARSQLLARLAD